MTQAAASYQINTWLESLEALDRRVFIVLRDHPLFARMASTTIPTLELKDPGELLMLDFSSARVALYPSNTGNNIHLLRLPTLMSAFIGVERLGRDAERVIDPVDECVQSKHAPPGKQRGAVH